MSSEDNKWIKTQIETYENAIRIAKKLNNEDKLKEYMEELNRLKSA